MSKPDFDYDACLGNIATGDQYAFESLYHHEAPHMLALAEKLLTDSTQAQQLVRDTFVLIWKHAESHDNSMGIARAWIYGILRDRALRTLRHPARTPSTAMPSTDDLRANTTGNHAHHADVRQTLLQLDATQRRPLLMAYYHGHTYRRIAAHLGLSVLQVQAHMRNALVRLQQSLPS